MSSTTSTDLHCALSVNETIVRWPATAGVFNEFGIDSCCGGAMSVEEAAREEGVDATALCDALREAVRSA